MADRMKIVLDPGHGGMTENGGSSHNKAIGAAPRCLMEKDLTLKVASILAQKLRGDFDVSLTRTGDTNLSLADRAAVARTNHADLFLSIHFNAASDPAVDGTEVWVAREASPRSRSFARDVQNRLVLATGAANRGVRERNLGVLVPSRQDPRTAACLVEVAFLTNPGEASRLEDDAYLGQITDALAAACRAQVPKAMAHAAGAGNGRGQANSYAAADPEFDEPAPVADQRYSGAMSDDDLERLYALPLEVVVRTVIDADARIRSGPPGFAAKGTARIPRFTRVRVEETNGPYARVTGLDGTAYGWTASSNLGTFFKDDAALASAALAPAAPVAIRAGWTGIRKDIAETYNRLGGLMQVLATQTKIELSAVLATWYVESAGHSHTVGKAVIRFENHLLFSFWGVKHPGDFDLHFQFGTRPPANGSACQHRWQCHKSRVRDSGDFEDTHQNQDSEYRALELAQKLAGEDAALRCISIGGSQVLGDNYAVIGYQSPREMFDAFQAGERAHVLGFFDYCQLSHANGASLSALREQRWTDFASGYNGSGRAGKYGRDIETAVQAATAVLAARPSAAQALDFTLGDSSIDLQFQVHLIPQPDKRSCWAASMSMVLSYYRQASVTPETLASEVGRSLRTSYDWDALASVRKHFLFKEVALPSNLSFVPPPSDWYRWLDQFGPLWVTVTGNPSHAIVVSGIRGDLTPSGTYIRALNPWDTQTRFDSDAVDFHPDNHGRDVTYSFAEFSKMFGTMGLANYGDWRVLYLGRRREQSLGVSELDVIDLSPEEIADAEPPRARAAGLDDAITRTLARRALGAHDARWADDDRSIDYRHLGAAGMSVSFSFTPALLSRLCELNRFDVAQGQSLILFGLRGCQFAGDPATGFVASVQLSETVPDHQNARCILGVWNRTAGQIRLFQASTVPNWTLMERFRQGGAHANLLPTGCYQYKVGSHRPGTPAEVPGAFLQGADAVILRTLDDLEYTISDTWDSGNVGDNIHPARFDQRAQGPFFSSAGCQTVPGNVQNGRHTGMWAHFRAAAGLSPASPASENNRRFTYVLLTGRDARLLAQGAPDNSLIRLRFGSSGADVTAIQRQLHSAGHRHAGAQGVFDVPTKLAYLAWQHARSAATADGVVTPSDAASLGVDIVQHRSTPLTLSLDETDVSELAAETRAYGDYSARPGMQRASDIYSRPLYDTGEHVLTGGANYENKLRVGKSPGVLFSYGQIIAMGDLYKNAKEMMEADSGELGKLKTLIERSTEYYRNHKADKTKDVKDSEWEGATSHRYLKLADGNYHHFSPNLFLSGTDLVSAARSQGDNKAEWQKYHKQAIDQARAIFAAGNQKVSIVPLGPLTTNAFGDHFLTDAFAAGHLINKAATIQLFKSKFFNNKSLRSEAATFFDKLADLTFKGYLKQQFSNLEETTRHISHLWHKFNITNASRFATVLKGVAEKAPDEIGNLAVKALHDQLKKDGLQAHNDAGDGVAKPWKLTGDGTMDDDNLAIIQKAVQQSIDNITDPSILVISPDKLAVFDYEKYYKRVWKFVPQLTAASHQKVQDELRVYTDPTSPRLLSDAAALLVNVDYVNLFIQKLIEKKALEWDT